MKSVEIVTVKPQVPQLEYQVVENGNILSHGHVIAYDPETHDTDEERQQLAEADATTKGLLP